MNKTTKRLGIWAALVTGILMIPFVARAPWTSSDYVFGGAILFGSATLYELITSRMKSKTHRIIAGIVITMMVICIWGLAVAD